MWDGSCGILFLVDAGKLLSNAFWDTFLVLGFLLDAASCRRWKNLDAVLVVVFPALLTGDTGSRRSAVLLDERAIFAGLSGILSARSRNLQVTSLLLNAEVQTYPESFFAS